MGCMLAQRVHALSVTRAVSDTNLGCSPKAKQGLGSSSRE